MTTLSTMESELLEATNTVTLLESVGCLLDEIFSKRVKRLLRVDNSAATAMILGGPGSWRTRHLRVRCSFVREQVQQGLLDVALIEGRYQLADLATKMHPRTRLLDLLHQWGFDGFPEEDVQIQMLNVVMLSCLVLALEHLPRASASSSDTGVEKEPLRASGMDELLLVAGAVAIVAVVLWEAGKFLYRCCVKGARRQSKIHKLRELARLTAELEIERLESKEQSPSGTAVQEAVQEAFFEAMRSGGSEPPRQVPVATSSSSSSNRVAGRERDAVTPRASPLLHPRDSPGTHSVASSQDDDVTNFSDRTRLCKDVLSLMTCESLKVGLRTEGLTVSGLKADQVARLMLRLTPDPSFVVLGRALPTDRQLRFVLWLWRHRHLQGRCQLEWSDVFTKESASRWIHKWKEG